MNWLLIVVLIILAGYTLGGYRKGLLRVLFSLASLLITILFVAWATPYISSFIKENTQIYQKVEKKCEEKVREETKEQIEQNGEQKRNVLEEYGITLPESIEEKLFGSVENGADSILESGGVYTAMAQPLAQLVVDGISFFAALILCAILLHLVGRFLDIASEIPVLRGINRVLGLGAGLLQGLVIVWVFFYLIAVAQAFPFGQKLLGLVQKSEFLKALYEENLVVYFVQLFL